MFPVSEGARRASAGHRGGGCGLLQALVLAVAGVLGPPRERGGQVVVVRGGRRGRHPWWRSESESGGHLGRTPNFPPPWWEFTSENVHFQIFTLNEKIS